MNKKSFRVKVFVFAAVLALSCLCSICASAADNVSRYNIYLENDIVFGMPDKTTFGELSNELSIRNNTVSIDGNYAVVMKTGDTLTINGILCTAAIIGDSDGDGALALNDLMVIKTYMRDAINLSKAQIKACDTNNDSRVTATDYLRLKRYLMSNYDIYTAFKKPLVEYEEDVI